MVSAPPIRTPAAPAPTRFQLALPITLPDDRPLIPLEAAQIILDLDEDSVLGEIERGTLGWAWDIRTEGATRREVRVWRRSLLQRAAGQDATAELEGVVESIFKAGEDYRLMQLARWLACSGSHVSNLIRDGLLALVGDRPKHSSAAAYTVVSRASVLRFFDSRRIA